MRVDVSRGGGLSGYRSLFFSFSPVVLRGFIRWRGLKNPPICRSSLGFSLSFIFPPFSGLAFARTCLVPPLQLVIRDDASREKFRNGRWIWRFLESMPRGMHPRLSFPKGFVFFFFFFFRLWRAASCLYAPSLRLRGWHSRRPREERVPPEYFLISLFPFVFFSHCRRLPPRWSVYVLEAKMSYLKLDDAVRDG